MKKIEMSEKAYIIVGDLMNVRLAKAALREICQPNSAEYISEKDYQAVMRILSKWSDAIHRRIECNDDEPDAESEEVCPACKVAYAINVDGAKVCDCPEKDE